MKKNILIIDDSESIREVVAQGLEEAGYNVMKAVNGSEGFQLLIDNPNTQLIITDLNMPVMDGIELVKAVRKIKEFKYLPVIILTTESQEVKKQEAKAAGATGWIIKPFMNEKLIAVVKKVLG